VPRVLLEETVTLSDLSVYSYEIQPDPDIQPDEVASTEFLLVNTLVKEYASLSSIELYGHAAGLIGLVVARIGSCPTPDSLHSLQDLATCANNQTFNEFTCTAPDSFTKVDGKCISELSTSQFDTLPNNMVSLYQYFSLDIQKGYNLFTAKDLESQADLRLQPGDMIMLDQGSTGKVAIDRSSSNTSPLSDYWLDENTLTLNTRRTGNKQNFYFRMTLSPVKTLSTFKAYSVEGAYNVSVVLNSQDPIAKASATLTATASVIIEDPILDLTLTTLTCQKDRVCMLAWSLTSGTAVTFNVTTNGSLFTTSLTEIEYVYKETGLFAVQINASNHVSQVVLDVQIECIDKLIGLNFHSGVFNKSTSVLGSDAQFLFFLKNGMGYTCAIDYGDGATDSFNDLAFNYNNTFFTNGYQREDVYIVTINCTGAVNYLYLEFNHYVQSELLGLSLVKPGTVARQPYYIEFKLLAGSSVQQTDLYVDGVLDTGTTWNQGTLMGLSSYNPNGDLYPGVHSVFINMSNIVSRVTLNTTFQISSPIINPTFRISPEADQYLYPASVEIVVSLESGANAKVEVWTGEEMEASVPTFVYMIDGKWMADLRIPYTFLLPGKHDVYLNVSNSINFVTTSPLLINIETPLNSLNAALYQKPVIYLLAGYGEAQFKFFFDDIATSGSDAQVTFWPGDAANDTYGPFEVGMNFRSNYNENPLSYRYTEVANFTASFLLENRFGSKRVQVTFEVIPGLDGFFIDCIPKRMTKLKDVEVSAFVVQGKDVEFNWFLDGVLLKTAMRKCKLI